MLQNDVLKLQEASAFLRCHSKTLRLMAVDGKVPAKRVGRHWRFSRKRLQEWIEDDSHSEDSSKNVLSE
jgi:excisionase family DNA binding protein